MFARLLLAAQGGDGGGNPGTPPPAPDANLTARLKQHRGDAGALAGELFAENRHLQQQLAESRKRHPPEGAVVLTGGDVATWNELRALGTPADVKAALAERDTLKGQVSRHDRDKALRAAGYNPDTLGPLLPADAAIELADGERGRDGKAAKVATIRVGAGDEAKPTPLGDWIGSNLAQFPAGTFGGPEAGAESRPAAPRGAPPTPSVRRDAPAPGEGSPASTPEAEVRALLTRERSYAF